MFKLYLPVRLFSVTLLFLITGFFPFFQSNSLSEKFPSRDGNEELSAASFFESDPTDPLADIPKNPSFYFTENRGQWADDIRFKLKMGGAQLFAEKNRLNFLLINPEDLAERSHRHAEYEGHLKEPVAIRCHRFFIDFPGASPDVKTIPVKKLNSIHNYFLGNDSSKWASNVGLYEEVWYDNLYPDIHLRLYGRGMNIKYDYVLEPAADPSQIVAEYNYADKLFLKDGKLHILTSVNEVIEQEPYAYQEIEGQRVKVKCDFKLEGNQVSFVFPEGYDEKLPLVIDPELVFASYSGAIGDNWGTTATYDDDGNLYAGGVAFDDYPTTAGAFQTNKPGGIFDPGNMGISKFSSDGSQLIYSTYLGGSGMEVPHSMIVNSNNELVIMGSTGSGNYPTANAFDNRFGGGELTQISGSFIYPDGSDIVISVLDALGANLVGSTYVGGGGNDGLHFESSGSRLNYSDEVRGEVILDEDDNIYVASTTYSADFPVTSGAYQTSHASIRSEDACIFKMNPTASTMIWATLLGGNSFDAAFSIKLDENRNAYVTGVTNSSNFPASSNAIHSTKSGFNSVGFLAQINSDGQALNAATFLNGSDFAYFVELDLQGNVYVIGQSRSGYAVEGNVYVNRGAFLFLHKLNPDFSATAFSTTLGRNRNTSILVPSAFLVDVCGRIYISGWGGTTNQGNISGLPVTSDAFQSAGNGSDFYLMVLQPDAADLEYASYFGGFSSDEHVDGGTSRFDKRGIIYQAVCAGCGGFDDFPTTPGVVSRDNNSSNCNLGVFKFDFQLGSIRAGAQAGPETSGCAPLQVDFTNLSTGATLYDWDFGDGGESTLRNPIHIFQTPGNYQVRMIASIQANCIDPDTAYLDIEVLIPTPGTNTNLEICENIPTQIMSSVTGAGIVYEWNDGSSDASIEISTGGIYWVDAGVPGNGICPQRDSFFINGIPNGTRTQTVGLCEGQLMTLASSNSFPAVDYAWNNGSSDRTLEIDDIGTYWVTAERSGCEQIDTFIVLPDSIDLEITVLDIDCVGQDSGLISARVIGGTSPYEFSINQSAFSSTDVFDGLAPNVYRLEARDINGCRDFQEAIIDLPPPVTVNLGDDQIICLGDSTDIWSRINISNNEVAEIRWSEFIKPDCPDCLRQNVRPVNTTTYQMYLESIDGCSGIDSVTIFVEPKRPLYVPSGFSPNDDGINDEFVIYSKPGLVKNVLVFRVFDRWGGLLFEQHDFQPNDPAFGWNGIFRGKKMNPAVFAWYAEVEFIDGYIELAKGDVTLMK